MGVLKSFLIFLTLSLFVYSCNTSTEKPVAVKSTVPVAAVKQDAPVDSTVTIMATGDLVLGSTYPDSINLPPDEGKGLFANVRDILNSADVTCGNLEGPLLDKGGRIKNCNVPKYCYTFRMPTKFGALLRDAGFDLLNLANNHSHDFGMDGADTTCEVLRKLGMAYAGLRRDSAVIITRNGVRYGYAAFAPYWFTSDLMNIEKAREMIESLSKKVDIVIVYIHGGAEGPEYRHVTRKSEYQFGSNLGDVYTFAHAMVDAGADVIIGVGPHVWRGSEIYKDRCIFYSIGNFCIYGRISNAGYCGISAIVKLKLKKDGSFVSGQLIPVRIKGKGIPELDKDSGSIAILRELSEGDFPESCPRITKKGEILKQDTHRAIAKNTPADSLHEIPISHKGYYVIVASYTDSTEAARYIAGLIPKTMNDGNLHIISHGKRFRVSSRGFSNISLALAFREKYQADFPKDAWIMNE